MQGIYIVVATLIILTENLTENLYLKLDTIVFNSSFVGLNKSMS